MSYLDTKQALITQFLAASVTGLTADDIGYQNKFFDPSNKALWVSLHFIPATSQMMGKTVTDKNEDRGPWIMQSMTTYNYRLLTRC
jgi:hypothetical protein